MKYSLGFGERRIWLYAQQIDLVVMNVHIAANVVEYSSVELHVCLNNTWIDQPSTSCLMTS